MAPLLIVVPLLAMASPPHSTAADVSSAHVQRGFVVAEVRCKHCHFLIRSNRKIGPGLLGVFDRAPTISGVPFARWDAEALDRWLTNPRAVKPNTEMRTPPIAKRDRADVIAWMATNY
ncbi:MAG: hypothetical protein Q9M26_01620 [Mariprofundales bacterium]|nr:hypothetical protein [Mariprofundales bacterium]